LNISFLIKKYQVFCNGCQIRVAGGEELVGAAFVGSTCNELPTNATVPVAGFHGCGEVSSPKNIDRSDQELS